MAKKKITAEEFDRKFDDGEDVSEFMDFENASRRVIIDIPLVMLAEIDKEATRLGIARQALLKVWIDEKLERLSERQRAKVG